MDDLYLDNIDEFVNDQNKIVTYKWLSLTLGVHVNTAKQMLYHYLQQKRNESSRTPLHATYLVSGKCVENGSTCHKVSVVREDKLDAVKAKMDMTISVHVYSVQRAELKDSSPLYNTDYDAVKENLKNCNKYSAIRCAAAVPMSSTELQGAQEMALVPPVEKEISKTGLNENTSATSKPSAKQPVGIMGMFASKNASKSQESSMEVKTEQKDDSSLVETSKSKTASKANPMSNFFGKSAQKKADEKPNKNIKEETAASSTATAIIKKSQTSLKSEIDIKDEQSKVSSALKIESKDTQNKTRRPEVVDSDDEKMERQQKKRRRIKKPQPDSSDDEVVPDSPPVPNVQTPSPKKEVNREPVSNQEESSEVKRRKRRRVLKSHTFVDEDGSFVTEKGYVSESYSESEEEPEPNSQAKDSSSLKHSFGKREKEKKEKSQKKTSTTNKPTKQPSIMGFFQKK
ncbi:DNA polymerase delta subunit 3 isoform X1 [Carassius carassius]|uniref:DNA polymerase delta subunit 3 isoform X1 n=2 Tax=Carassius carassius TaxID=217509 RepID=UPI0028691689|nr:DNA polymerase delta subunit 3 isoform X1 [Carassius carassius]